MRLCWPLHARRLAAGLCHFHCCESVSESVNNVNGGPGIRQHYHGITLSHISRFCQNETARRLAIEALKTPVTD